MDFINNQLNDYIRQQIEYTEREYAVMMQNYDFIVGSIECMHKLAEIVPKDCKIVCSPYINDTKTIFAIKRIDISDLLYAYNEINNDNWYMKRFKDVQ